MTFAKHKKIETPTFAKACLNSAEAELLVSLLTPALKRKKYAKLAAQMINSINDQLTPEYVYEIKCQDCPRTFEYRSRGRLDADSFAEGGICSRCSDDYK